jgi:hypothetical protein
MTWGPMTIARERLLRAQGVHIHVLHKGQDVTDRCTFADDTPGQEQAELFRLNAAGAKFLEDEDGEPTVARETVRGDIVIVSESQA